MGTRGWILDDPRPTTHGRAQAHELAETLRNRRVTHIWTSTLVRAVRTAEIAAALLGRHGDDSP